MFGVQLRRFARSAARLARTRYPAFVFGGTLPRAEIPVFTYHDVEPEALRADLAYLERNGYRTLALDEFHAQRAGLASGVSPRAVLLAFDDARQSFWNDALPVLRESGVRAALFVPSYWMRGSRNADMEPAQEGEDPCRGFMTWEQLRECDRSGVVDVESHGHRHALIAIRDRVVAFATPRALAHYDLFDWPMRRERGADVSGPPELGTPVYESQPMLSAAVRLLEPPAVAEACRRIVLAGGGPAFFLRRDARRRLQTAYTAAVSREGGLRAVSSSELLSQVEAELEQAVFSFERELGRRPRYFAYPWMLGTRRTLEMLADLGIEAAFGVALDYSRARTQKQPLPVYGRYKSDWLQCLPGKGRRRLRQVLPQKLGSFVASQHLAH